MKLQGILPFARSLLTSAINTGEIAIDATVGNGHDTVFLANLVGENGQVFGFDIQKEAITNTTKRLKEQRLDKQVTLFHKGHEEIVASVPANVQGNIKGAIFNLGYLPGGDKTIVTQPNTTIAAVEQVMELLAPEGIIVLVIYHGHPEGQTEKEELLSFVKQLDQKKAHVLKYQYINQENHPPFIIAIEKR